jgi:4a-hydroxytetrahydrobiopterin dehydratase
MMAMVLSAEDVQQRLARLPGWRFEDASLVRQFTLPSFPDAIAFTTRLAFDAEAADHHPDLTISYRRVTVRWSTHSEGGVTDKDIAGAMQSDAVAARFAARA